MKLLKNKKLLIVILFLIITSFLLYRNFTSSAKTKKIESTKVKQGTLEEKMTISGSIEGDEHVTLRFQTSGRLAWVGVKEGDYVKKFQTIASLDKREMQKKLQSELYDYMKTRWDFEEAKKDTYKDKLVTDTVKRILEKNQFDLNKAVLDVELLDISNEFANLWSPIEGLVTKVGSPYSGVNITPSTAEFEIVNPKTIYFAATADQNEVTRLSKNMSGELILDAYPEATISGIIKDISFVPKTGETSTVYAVKFVFENDNSNYKYRISMAGDLSFVVQKKENVLYVPIKFVRTQNNKKYLKIKRNGNEENREVTAGMETDSDIEITSGVTLGETIYN